MMKKKIKLTVLAGAIMVICVTFAACGSSQGTVKPDNSTKPAANTTTTTTNENETPAVNIVQGPGFTKTALAKNTKAAFATPWKTSPGNKLSACIEGKGPEAKEEGIAKIYFKDSTGNMWQLALSDNKKQNTPMHIEWWDDNNLLVVIGYGYGTVSLGGNLYLINVESGKTALLIENKDSSNKPDPKQQVISASRDNNDIKYEVAVYEDNTLNKYHIENRVLSSYGDKIKAMAAGLK